MENYLQPIYNTLLTVEKLFPPEKESTKFDKVIDLIKAVSSGTPWGVVGQAIEVTGKVCSTISSGKQRVQTVKYVKDAYEAKLRAEEEMAKINARIATRQTQERLLTLYIERSFQKEIDAIGKKIMLESHSLDMKHEERMEEIHRQYSLDIKKLDNIAKQQLSSIDKNYAAIVRRNEMYCLLYRQYLKFLQDTKTTPGQMISAISQRYMDIVEKAVFQPGMNLELLSRGLDGSMKLLQFLGNPDTFFISFDQFISQKKKIEDLSI